MNLKKASTKIKIFTFASLMVFAILIPAAVYFATKITSNYSMDQFLPKKHPLLTWDRESKKIFHVAPASPHILLLSLDKKSKSKWHDDKLLNGLIKLTQDIEKQRTVKTVVSLGNIQSAYEQKDQLIVGTLKDLRHEGFNLKAVLDDPLYTPNIISKDGRHTAIFVIPDRLTQAQHEHLIQKMNYFAKKHVPDARVRIGGPAAIRTQLLDLLTHELMIFLVLSLLAAMAVVRGMFHSWWVLPKVMLVLVVVNVLCLGLFGLLGISVNILTSTLPIIVTVTALGITNHTIVRMAAGSHLPTHARLAFMKKLLKELLIPHALTASTTAAGYACLIPSYVAIISDFGKIVSLGVLVSAMTALMIVPHLLLWTAWPKPRKFLTQSNGFSFFLVRKAKYLAPGVAALVALFAVAGLNLSWTARIFDDLPLGHPTRSTTDLIAKQLGGVAGVDFMVGSNKRKDTWKNPIQVRQLHRLAQKWRQDKKIGSVITLADFMATGTNKNRLPKKRKAIAELQFLYGMSGDSPLKQYLSSDEKWTRIAVRLPDLPASQNKLIIAKMQKDLRRFFPGLKIKTSGLATIVPTINDDISRQLMWGFFEALFWIVLLISIALRSLKWGLVAVLPNLVPPAVLVGMMALLGVDIKPGIAIIFAISLGMSFDNTVYVLLRLRYILNSKPKTKRLPIYSLMKKETIPCLVSSSALMAGFSIFLFSQFPVNKMFGAFMLIAIVAGLLGDLVWLPALLRRLPWLLLEQGAGMSERFALSGRWRRAATMSPYLIFIVLGLFAFRYSFALFP
ncbi:MAG: RND family transporter [Bdellovibrionales bacterium]